MIRVRLFGDLALDADDGSQFAAVLAQPKRMALLAYLALAGAQHRLRRDSLLAVFWPDLPTGSARTALRKSLHFLRSRICDEVLVGAGEEQVGLCRRRVWCDVVAFREAVRAGRYVEALDLYRGDLMAGFHAASAREFEPWLERQRQELRSEASGAALALSQGEAAEDRFAQATHWARRAVSLEPFGEGPAQWLMYLLDRGGDRGAAGVHALRAAAAERVRRFAVARDARDPRASLLAERRRRSSVAARPCRARGRGG